MCSRNTSRGQGLKILEVHRALLWRGGRQAGLSSCSLKPLGNMFLLKVPGALLSSSNKPSSSCYLFGLKPGSPRAVRQNSGAYCCYCQILLDAECLKTVLLETSWSWVVA